jgi:Fe-S-cluster-containing dehydrogenase component
MQKRNTEGIVFVDHALCVGCKACITACPWGAPQWHPEVGKAVRCDYCIVTVDQGLKPACVTVYIPHCLAFSEIVDESVKVRKQRHAEAVAALDK